MVVVLDGRILTILQIVDKLTIVCPSFAPFLRQIDNTLYFLLSFLRQIDNSLFFLWPLPPPTSLISTTTLTITVIVTVNLTLISFKSFGERERDRLRKFLVLIERLKVKVIVKFWATGPGHKSHNSIITGQHAEYKEKEGERERVREEESFLLLATFNDVRWPRLYVLRDLSQ